MDDATTDVVATDSERIAAIEEKVDKIYVSVEKTRRYYLTSMIVTILFFVLPLIGLIFAIPSFLDTYSELTDLGTLGY